MSVVEFYDAYAPFYDVFYDHKGDISLYLEHAKTICGPVLECGVGTGRIAIPLAKAGLNIIGIDINSKMLAIARQKIAREIPDIRSRIKLIKADMRSFQLKERFPLCIIPPYAFLELSTAEDQEATLRNVNQHLSREGKLIVYMFNPDLKRQQNVVKVGKIRRFKDELMIRFDTESFDFQKQTITVQWFVDTFKPNGFVKRVVLPPLKLRYVFYDEMEQMLECAGYKVEAVYGDEEKNQYRADSSLMIFVTRKREG